MNEIQVFSSAEFGEIRTIEEEGKTWFCGADVAKVLGYGSNPQDAIRRHCREDGCVNHAVIDSMGRKQQAKFITEGNVFRLITHSKLPKAEKFESWVFDEILPTIHRTGGYGNTNNNINIEVISKITTAVIKELLPIITENLPKQNELKSCKENGYRRSRGTKSKIEQLPPAVKSKVDRMLKNETVYKEVSEFCKDKGYDISMSAVGRYDKKRLENEECTDSEDYGVGSSPHKVTTFPKEIRMTVDFMVQNKISDHKVAKYCCENGYDISAMSIWRYRQVYFPYR